MSALSDHLDRFVRWFFNSSPTTLVIESIEPRREQKGEHANHRQTEYSPLLGTRRKACRARSQPQAKART